MCIIIDANAANECTGAVSPDAEPIMKWLLSRKGKLAIGGRLTRELAKTQFRRLLLQLDKAGAVMNYGGEVDTEEDLIKKLGLCKSDDEHVIALARISGCRLVFTRDVNLHTDVKNTKLLRPKGKVYCSRTQAYRLLNKCPECKPYAPPA